MKTGAAAGMGLQTAASIDETNDHMTAMTSTTRHEEFTRQNTMRRHESKQEALDNGNGSKAPNHEQNSHPAWNPDSRWSR